MEYRFWLQTSKARLFWRGRLAVIHRSLSSSKKLIGLIFKFIITHFIDFVAIIFGFMSLPFLVSQWCIICIICDALEIGDYASTQDLDLLLDVRIRHKHIYHKTKTRHVRVMAQYIGKSVAR